VPAIATTIAAIFLVLSIGYALRRIGFPTGRGAREGGDSFWIGADRLVYWLLFPSLLFQETSHAALGSGVVGAYGLCLLGALVLTAMAALAVSRAAGFSGAVTGSVLQGAMRHNTFIAFAVCDGLFGAAGMTQAALATAMLVPVTNLVAVGALVILHHEGGAASLGRRLLRELLRNPLLIAIALGLTVNVSGPDLPEIFTDAIGLLSRVTLPLALLCIGAALRMDTLRRAGTALVVSALGKLLLFPAVVFALIGLSGLTGMPAIVAAIYGAVPTAVSGYALARQFGSDAELMAGIITLQTLVAIVSMPLTLALALNWFG
jgi:predicted permease